MRIEHDIDRRGTLYWILCALLGAYDRRTLVMQRASETDPAMIQKLTDKLNADSANLAAAIKNTEGDS